MVHSHPKVNAESGNNLPLVLNEKVSAFFAQVSDEIIRTLLITGNLSGQKIGKGVTGVVGVAIFARDDCAVLISLRELAKLLVCEIDAGLESDGCRKSW